MADIVTDCLEAIVGAPAPPSATSSEQRGSALLDSGKSMVGRMAQLVADCEA
jgi:hypothetical protein